MGIHGSILKIFFYLSQFVNYSGLSIVNILEIINNPIPIENASTTYVQEVNEIKESSFL